MAGTFTINLAGPIELVKVLDNYNCSIESFAVNETALAKGEHEEIKEQLESQMCLYEDTNKTLKALISKLKGFYEDIFAGHKEQIAKLSVEIARKILMQKVKEGDYQIESIVKEVIGNAPSNRDIVIYLNPEDLAACQNAQEGEAFAGVKFVEDKNINRAECRLESPKGIIKSLINEHLEQIEKTLSKTE